MRLKTAFVQMGHNYEFKKCRPTVGPLNLCLTQGTELLLATRVVHINKYLLYTGTICILLHISYWYVLHTGIYCILVHIVILLYTDTDICDRDHCSI